MLYFDTTRKSMPPAWRKMMPWEWTWMDMKVTPHPHSRELARNPTLPNSSDEPMPKSNKLCTQPEYQTTRYSISNSSSTRRRRNEHPFHPLLFLDEIQCTTLTPRSGHRHSHLPSRHPISHSRPPLSHSHSKTSTSTRPKTGPLKTGLNSPSTKYPNLKLFASPDKSPNKTHLASSHPRTPSLSTNHTNARTSAA